MDVKNILSWCNSSFIGFAHDGCPVFFGISSYTQPWKAKDADEILMSSIWFAEVQYRWCIETLKRAPQVYMINTVANQTEQHKKFFQYGKRNNKILPVMYPAMAKGIYVLNAGTAIRMLWAVFKRFLSANL